MHPSLEPFVGKRVALTMKAGPPWYGHRIVGDLERAPDGAAFKLTHKRAGDVILLPSAVGGIAEAKARE